MRPAGSSLARVGGSCRPFLAAQRCRQRALAGAVRYERTLGLGP